jgi:polysaccharide biosynthesis transport protein
VSHLKKDPKVVGYPAEVISITQSNYKDDDSDFIDFRAVLSTIWRSRWGIAAMAIALAVLIGVLMSRLEPQYNSDASVMFGIQQTNIADLQQLLTSPDFDPDELENEIQVLRSRSLLERVVRDLGLQDNPGFNPALAEEEGGARAWIDGILARIGLEDEPEPELSPAEEERRKIIGAVSVLQEELVLLPVGGSSVIQISYTSDSARLSADIVNAVADQFIVDQLQVKLEATNAATEWLSTRVEELRQKVQTSEEAVEILRSQLSTDAGQGLEITQQQLAALNSALSTARGQAASAEARYQRLGEALENGTELGAESETIRQYREEMGDLQARRDTLSANHPAIPQLDGQIQVLRDRIRDEGERIVEGAEVELETNRTQVEELERAVRELESKALSQSRDEIRIRQLEREAEANRLLYESLLVRLNETSEQEDLQSADARILSSAEVAVEPVSSGLLQAVVAAGILGGIIATAFVVIRDNFNNTFRSPRQIEAMTGHPVLATLPTLGARTRNRDLIGHLLRKPGSSLAEAVRNLRTSILLPNSENPPKVVMFTSSIPGEGKSTTSMLTAITSRQMGMSTIIVDCDLRLSSFEQLLDVKEDEPGILSVLDGSATLEDALHEDPATGLHVLMVRRGERAVKTDRNAADILSSRKFAELVRYLSQIYDVVILDTPPALVVTDARIVSSFADKVVYVVRWSKTPRDAVQEGLKELRSVRAPVAGMVLSMINEAKAAKSSFDGYTHHRGRYGAYYTSDR